jgi:hypothetical protein
VSSETGETADQVKFGDGRALALVQAVMGSLEAAAGDGLDTSVYDGPRGGVPGVVGGAECECDCGGTVVQAGVVTDAESVTDCC